MICRNFALSFLLALLPGAVCSRACMEAPDTFVPSPSMLAHSTHVRNLSLEAFHQGETSRSGGNEFLRQATELRYTVMDLGIWPGSIESEGYSINANGQTTGNGRLSGFGHGGHAYRTTATGKLTDPGTDLGARPGRPLSEGNGINDAGQVVGTVAERAFRTSPTGKIGASGTALGLLPGGSQSNGLGINNRGQVVGWGDTGQTYQERTERYAMVPGTVRMEPTGEFDVTTEHISHAFRVSPTGTLHSPGSDLGVFPTGRNSQGNGINASGQITGKAEVLVTGAGKPKYLYHAFRTTATGSLSDGTATNLGFLPGGFSESIGYAINASGQVVGMCNVMEKTESRVHAFRTTANGTLSDGTATDIPPPPGCVNMIAFAINDAGDVVGSYRHPNHNDTGTAFLFTDHLILLNQQIPSNSGWHLEYAQGINNRGQITGTGFYKGHHRAFRLTPIAPHPGG